MDILKRMGCGGQRVPRGYLTRLVGVCLSVLAALLLTACSSSCETPRGVGGLRQSLGNGDALAFSRMDVNLFNPGDLYLVDDVAGIRPLTQGGGYDGRPVWSPDGTQIVYTSAYDGWFYYYLVDVDGKNRRLVTPDDDFKDLFRWSPDGSRLAYLAYERSGDVVSTLPSLCITEIDSGETHRASVGDIEDFVWVEDGRSLLLIVRTDGIVSIERYGVGDGRAQPVADASYLRDAVYVALSPQGDRVVYVAPAQEEEGDCLTNPMNSVCFTTPMYVSSLDGSAATQVGRLWMDGAIAWSPDGTRLAFVTLSEDFDNVLYVVNADGSGGRQLMLLDTADESGEILPAAPAWSLDGRRIAISSFVSAEGSAIFVLNADSADRWQITDPDGLIYDLAWRPGGSGL